jgi:hypothetical protein
MTRRLILIVIATAALSAGVVAQRPSPSDFRFERAVQLGASGPHRLDVDVTLLSGAAPFVAIVTRGDRSIAQGGLADLRFYDGASREVPYLLIPPPLAAPLWLASRVLRVATTEKASGFEVELAEAKVVDAIRLEGMQAPFLKRLVLEGSGDREHWTLVIAEGTAFDLPAEGLAHTTIPFEPGLYRFLRVTWDDTNSGRVEPPASVSVRSPRAPIAPSPVLRMPVPIERRPSEPGRSRFRITLPAARLPIAALELAVAGGHLLREATVTEARLSDGTATPDTIGRAMLRRVVRDGIAADALRIPVRQPHEARLDLLVEDGDNPPLELTAVTAVFAELPWIYLEHQAATLHARYGNAKLTAPHYDLEAARSAISDRQTTMASWGEPGRIASSTAVEAAALPLPETGSTLDAGEFVYARDIPQGAAGLITVPLDAAVLAHSEGLTRFADVRVLDPRGRQVPYLLERRDEPIALDVGVSLRDLPADAAQRVRGRRTSYVVHLPYRRLPSARLALQTRARVFERNVSVAVLVPPSERQREWRLEMLGSHLWRHSDQETTARALTVDVPEERNGDLVVLVDEGDNERLPIEKGTLLLPSYAVRLFRRADDPLRLVYGRGDVSAPQYDLALLAPQVLGQVATEVIPSTERRSQATTAAAALVSPPVFWASLALAVMVLLGVIVRLLREPRRENHESRT